MDTNIVSEMNGDKFNRFGQKIIPCIICGDLTTMTGTKHCDRCHELDLRIRLDLDLAEKIIAKYKN